MNLTDFQLTGAMHDFIRECDADELARLAGEIFGGDCHWIKYDNKTDDNIYDFEPNENYCGQFGEIS